MRKGIENDRERVECNKRQRVELWSEGRKYLIRGREWSSGVRGENI